MHSMSIELPLFDRLDGAKASSVIALDPRPP
jgi:hypothetical protein